MRTRHTGCAVFSRGKTDCLFGVFRISVLHFGKQQLRQREIRLIAVQFDVQKKLNILILKFMFVIVALWFLRQQRQQKQRSDMNSMLSVDNNKNNFYQPKGWLPLETCLLVVFKNIGVVDKLSLKNKA